MGGVAITGNDTLTLGPKGGAGRVFADFADADNVGIDIPNDLVAMTIGKGGNALYAINATGEQVTLTMRLLLGSADDKYMNSQLSQVLKDAPSYPLLEGSFTKRVGDGAGAVTNVDYSISGAIPSKIPVVKENQAGDTEQAVAVWTIIGLVKRKEG